MKADDPLAAALSGLPVPPASPEARERALHRATIALRQSAGRTPEIPERRTGRRFAWGLAGSLAMFAVLAMAAVFWAEKPARTQAVNARSIEADQTVLGQMKALFGPQLNAVVESPGEAPDIRLADGADAGETGLSQPVLVEFTRGEDMIRVLGYSGRAVCVKLAGRSTYFEPLATGDGEVILDGEGFCWTPRDRALQVSGYRISTRLLSSL